MKFTNPLSFFKKINQFLNIYNSNSNKINDFITNSSKEFQNINEKIDDLYKIVENSNKNNNETINEIDNIKSSLNNLTPIFEETKLNNKSISLLNDKINNNSFETKTLIEEYKKYYFKTYENDLKENTDTEMLFKLGLFAGIDFLTYSRYENKFLLKTKENIILATNNRFITISAIIGFDSYAIPQLYELNNFVVFDIGMNRGYSALRFANFQGCKKVFGFEIHPKTYDMALYNFKLNTHLANKIKPYNFGLSNENKIIDLFYLKGADGISTTKKDFTNISNEWISKKDKIQTQQVKVKKSSEIIENIITQENITSKIVLKIDTEGSEYDIINDLIETNVIKKIDIIIGEGHILSTMNNFEEELIKRDFIEIENTLVNPKINKCYDFVYIKKELVDVWDLND